MHTLLALLLFVVVFVVPNKAIVEDVVQESPDKRQVSVLARDGQLPYEGKRYVGEKKPDDMNARNLEELNNSPAVFLVNKRYVGALARSGDLKFKQQDDKREDVDTLIDELLTAEELKKIRLEALREELLKQREQEEEEDEELEAEKRSLASLARSHDLPFRGAKRSIASMAKAGYLRQPLNLVINDDYDKRGIASIARNGELPSFGKRGGISSLMRNGYPLHKRGLNYDLDSLFDDDYDMEVKRNVASLARSFNLPSMGKRNIASFARNGWLPNLGPNAKKSFLDNWDDFAEEDKRNVQSILRNRLSPIVTGKRYLGAFMASNGFPSSRNSYDDSKRNFGSMVRSWNTPQSYRYGKREYFDDEDYNEELRNRVVPSNIQQAPEADHIRASNDEIENYENNKLESGDTMNQEKRHIGSVLSHKSFAMRKKKSILPEDQLGEPPSTVRSPTKSLSDENKMDNTIQQNTRHKRDALMDLAAASDEYSVPVMQNTREHDDDYDDGISRTLSEEQSVRKKRYFAVRGGGKIPGGRLPHVGRSRSNNPNSGRRRH